MLSEKDESEQSEYEDRQFFIITYYLILKALCMALIFTAFIIWLYYNKFTS